MKAIKDCEWVVSIYSNHPAKFKWIATCFDYCGIFNLEETDFDKTNLRSISDWRRFAKLNKIKHWDWGSG